MDQTLQECQSSIATLVDVSTEPEPSAVFCDSFLSETTAETPCCQADHVTNEHSQFRSYITPDLKFIMRSAYFSGIESRFFMFLTCWKWNDMSVASTISITNALSSLTSKHITQHFQHCSQRATLLKTKVTNGVSFQTLKKLPSLSQTYIPLSSS